MKIIVPKRFVPLEPRDGPLFFLAGPVLGGDDWQARCCVLIEEYIPDFYAVIPCRWTEEHPFSPYFVPGIPSEVDRFSRQTHWERYYLMQAAMWGCVIFWLPCESKANPRTDGLPYAMDTRGELGEWRVHMLNPYYRVVIGAEKGFFGLSVIHCNFESLHQKPIHFWGTLEETVRAAVAKIK